MKNLKEKTFKFTTYNKVGEEIETYITEQYSVKDARKYARLVVAISRDNECKHGRVTLLNK